MTIFIEANRPIQWKPGWFRSPLTKPDGTITTFYRVWFLFFSLSVVRMRLDEFGAMSRYYVWEELEEWEG